MADKEPEDLNSMLDAIEGSPAHDTPPSSLPTEYESPTLAMLDAKRRPNPLPVCAACPQSLWFASADHLQCYCRLMHVRTWDSQDPQPILQCDGPILSTE